MRWPVLLTLLALACCGASPVYAQTYVQQSGNVTPGHQSCWLGTSIIYDCGVPAQIPYLLTNPPLTLADAAVVTPDFNLASVFTWTLTTTGRTLANPANLSSAQLGQRLVLYLVQGGSGSDTITTWGSVYKFSGGSKPTLSTSVGAVDRVICDIMTTTFLTCAAVLNFQ